MQYEDTQYEQTIDLAALIADALRKWKWMVVAILIGVLVCGAYRGILRPAKVDNTAQIETITKAIDTLTATRKANEATIGLNEQTIQAAQDKIAEYQQILEAQQSSLTTIDSLTETLKTTLTQAQAMLTDPETTEEQLAVVIEQIPALTMDLVNTTNQRNSILQQISTTQDNIITKERDAEKARIDNEALEKTNEGLEKDLEKQQKSLDALDDGAGIRPVIVFMAVGGILGLGVFCVVVFLQYLFDHKLRASEELRQPYHLQVLGEFRSAAAEKHGKFGRMLDNLSGDVQTLPEAQRVYELIAAGIQASVAPSKLLITGTVAEAELQAVLDKLASLLPKAYTLRAAVNPVYNAGVLAELKQYAVVLVEVKHTSDKREIAKLANLLWNSEIKTVGIIVK